MTALVLRGQHSCALTSEGGVKCWGANWYGQLGDASFNNSSTPVDVVGLSSGVIALSTGWSHSCALTSTGGVKCWGGNYWAQLGDGTNNNAWAPVDVAGLTSGVKALASGMYHTCALTTAGGVKCWGPNYYGELGDGTKDMHNTPVDVVGLSSGVSTLAAGNNNSFALIEAGGVKGWGWNAYGILGDGTTTDQTIPVDAVVLSEGISIIAPGHDHTCVLTTAGAAKCWGFNSSGQLGDGTYTQRDTPEDVAGLSDNVIALSAGGGSTCGLTVGGRAKCWGGDREGQLGLGTITQRLTPMAVVASVPASLSLNYLAGQPGSYFTLTGANFPASSTATVLVNSQVVTDTLQVNETGGFIFFFDTNGAEEGGYMVEVKVNPSAKALFTLNNNAPLHPQEGGGQSMILLPDIGVDYLIVFLPLGTR